ncbi:MAG TPA: MarR family transcriptional regulator [Acidimicrobiia bacterium]|nr:MarR family transcriptional regulator [Acidimicrobiia bacterium]
MSQAKFINDALSEWGRTRPELDLFGLGVIGRLIWSGRLAEEILERTAQVSGLRRRGDFEVLSLLRRVEPSLLTPIEVAQQLRTSQSGMTGKLDRLEHQGLIQRRQDPDDRRAIRLGITETGRTLIDEAFDTTLRVYESMIHGFAPNEVKNLDALLAKLLTRLDELSDVRQPWAVS